MLFTAKSMVKKRPHFRVDLHNTSDHSHSHINLSRSLPEEVKQGMSLASDFDSVRLCVPEFYLWLSQTSQLPRTILRIPERRSQWQNIG